MLPLVSEGWNALFSIIHDKYTKTLNF
jgi:hypothetical protein